MLHTTTSMSQALHHYRRLCRVKDVHSAQYNRVSALSILWDGLAEHQWRKCLLHFRNHEEITSGMLSDALDITNSVAATHLLNLWKETVEVRGLEEEHIFLERRTVTLAKGGREFCYRLSELGQLLMHEEGLPC